MSSFLSEYISKWIHICVYLHKCIFSLHPKYANVSKMIIKYGVSWGLYCENHKPFNLKYVNRAGQEEIFESIQRQLNLPAPLIMDEVEFPVPLELCPAQHDPDWLTCSIKDLDEIILQHFPNFSPFPEITEDKVDDLLYFCNPFK